MYRLSIKDIYKDESYYSGSQSEPVSLSEAKTHLLIESAFTDDDIYILSLIQSARNKVEEFCNISIQNKLITLTLSLYSNKWPYKRDPDAGFFNNGSTNLDTNNWYELPYGPVKYVYAVTSFNRGTITPFVNGQDYYLEGTQFQSIQFVSYFVNVVMVYQVGWPTIPYALKQAILNEIAFRYENRGDNTNRYAQQNVGLCEAAEYLAKTFQKIAV